MARARGRPATIFPSLPQPGDTVGVVAPASAVDRAQFERGCERLRARGYKTFFFESILERERYFAGSLERRRWELEQMFLKPFVKAIVCARGGYGASYLLPTLNMDVVRANPKLLIGYSDITALLTYVCDQADLVTCHGPMVAKDFAAGDATLLPAAQVAGRGPQVRCGEATGVLYGGCLSILVASLGTPFAIDTENTILFLEDVNAKPYQVDRMLTQLKLAGKLAAVRGIVWGEMPGCAQPGEPGYTVQDVIRAVLADFPGPIGFGVRSGHLHDHALPGVALPIGASATLTVMDEGCSLTIGG